MQNVTRRWKLSNEESGKLAWFLQHESSLRMASKLPWPQLQRLLVQPDIDQLVSMVAAIERELTGAEEEAEYCRGRLALPTEILNPPPILTGDDLKEHGIPPGKVYRLILENLRDAQLNQEISTKDDALKLAGDLWESICGKQNS